MNSAGSGRARQWLAGETLHAKELDSVSSEEGAAPAGEPAWHGSSVEVDDLWPGAAPAQEVSPRSMEL